MLALSVSEITLAGASAADNGSGEGTVRLKDGRHLSFLEMGDRKGRPVFVFHGLPGSRLPTGAESAIAFESGLRLISVDRPGIGLSSFQADRRIVDWPTDVAELADHLGIARMSVMGVSAGGAYALACGSELSDRLDKLVLASSMVPFELPGVARTFDPARRLGYWMIGNVPGQSRWVAWLQARAVRGEPAALLERISSNMSQRDRDLLEGSDGLEPLMAHLAEAYRQGSAGVAHEMKLIARPWGIRLDAITVEVDLFHGELDLNIPVAAARLLSDAIPSCRPTIFSGEAHLGSRRALESALAALAAD